MTIKAHDQNHDRSLVKPAQDKQQQQDINASRARTQSFQIVMHKKQVARFGMLANNLRSPLKSKPLNKSVISDVKSQLGSEKSEMPLHVEKEFHKTCLNNFSQHVAVEKISEQDPNILAHSAIASGRADDINLLIKKLTLNFSAKNNRASFSIATGVFAGAQFSIVTENRDLRLTVNDASVDAQRLLKQHQPQLKTMLAAREINLHSVLFTS